MSKFIKIDNVIKPFKKKIQVNGDKSIWEREPLMELAAEGQLSAYKHDGFWMPMDTLRDKNKLEDLWQKKLAPWKIW